MQRLFQQHLLDPCAAQSRQLTAPVEVPADEKVELWLCRLFSRWSSFELTSVELIVTVNLVPACEISTASSERTKASWSLTQRVVDRKQSSEAALLLGGSSSHERYPVTATPATHHP